MTFLLTPQIELEIVKEKLIPEAERNYNEFVKSLLKEMEKRTGYR